VYCSEFCMLFLSMRYISLHFTYLLALFTCWIGDCLRTGKPSQDTTDHPVRLSLLFLWDSQIEYRPAWLCFRFLYFPLLLKPESGPKPKLGRTILIWKRPNFSGSIERFWGKGEFQPQNFPHNQTYSSEWPHVGPYRKFLVYIAC